MEYFRRAKAVRLKSQHNKFLVAEDNEESVKQRRNGSSKSARWIIEPVEGKPNRIRFKSCSSWKYLSASDDPFLLGMTGKKVIQASPRLRQNQCVEWEPIKEGNLVKLRTPSGNFLRANGGIPPWMNSVTHDVPSRSSTQDWILWNVDVLEVVYESPAVSVVDQGGNLNHEEDKEEEVYSSSPIKSSSIGDESDGYKDYYEVGSEVSSVHHQNPVPTPTTTPGKPNGVPPDACHDAKHHQHSNSFNKLKSTLDGVQDLLDDSEEEDTKSEAGSEYSSGYSSLHPHPIEVQMAKETLKELKPMNFNEILSSGKDERLEKAINILIADLNLSARGQLPKQLTDLPDRVRTMTHDHDSACQDLVDCSTIVAKKTETKAELKKEAAKAHELETLEAELNNVLVNARAKKEELLKQLEEVENNIQDAERSQADNAVAIEELISKIGKKSESLREMEKQEKTVQLRKFEAECELDRVENEWVKVKGMFHDV